MLSRRRFLVSTALAAGASAIPASSDAAPPEKKQPAAASAGDFRDWNAVRRQFDLDPRYTHMGLFYLTSHPRPVRAAIEDYRKKIDANPHDTVEDLMFLKPPTLPVQCAAPSPHISVAMPMTSR